MSDEEFEGEPIPGLPAHLPPGEHILWQGQPGWRSLARQAFHVRGLTLYFAIFIAGRGVVALAEGQGPGRALLASLGLVPLAAACVGLLTGLAWLTARATIYTITTRRVVLRFGVALPMSINLPFKQVVAADLVARPEGDGDIALRLAGPGRLGYLPLWPYVRPWRVAPAQPMLRAVPDVKRVSAVLAEAVQAWTTTKGIPEAAETVTVTATGATPPTSSRSFAVGAGS